MLRMLRLGTRAACTPASAISLYVISHVLRIVIMASTVAAARCTRCLAAFTSAATRRVPAAARSPANAPRAMPTRSFFGGLFGGKEKREVSGAAEREERHSLVAGWLLHADSSLFAHTYPFLKLL